MAAKKKSAAKSDTTDNAAPVKRRKTKLSVKACFGRIIPANLSESVPTAIINAFGLVTGIKRGQGTYGEWVAFQGAFTVVNMTTGEEFDGGTLYLPSAAEEAVATAFAAGDGTPVRIAWSIGAFIDPDATTAYVYECTDLLGDNGAGADIVAAIRSEVGA